MSGNTVERGQGHLIVGIGASAGSLEAIEQLIRAIPVGTGMSFVLVQHLSPDFKSMMGELLARHTHLPIRSVENEMVVEPNTIYLMPPRAEMIISNGRLLLTERGSAPGPFLPVDTFFRSLAADAGFRAVGVILSGTGSDGARGIREIHEAGGLVIAQDPDVAKFDGMPRSAVDTGIVDLVLGADAIADALVAYGEHMQRTLGPEGHAINQETRNAAEAIFALLRRESGIDFSSYKPATVARRIDRRLLLTHASSIDEYIHKLENEPAELTNLYRDLLIGITGFFRDRDMFARLQREVMPELVAGLGESEELRIWVVACATGEEAYSIAMLAHEAFRQLEQPPRLKIFATDVHRTSLETAGAGVYSSASLLDVPEELRQRYFTQHQDHYRITPELRNSVVFARHNVLRDAPFTRLHMVSCRNLLIYFNSPAQRKTVALFHFGLQAGGVMVLGPSETPGPLTDEFKIIDQRWKVYRKRRDARLSAELQLGATHTMLSSARLLGKERVNERERNVMRAREVLAARYAPAAWLLTSSFALVHTFNGGGRYLAQRDGRATLDILELVSGEMRFVVASALKRALEQGQLVRYGGVHVTTGETTERVNLTVEPLPGGDGSTLLLVALEPMEELADDTGSDSDVASLDLQAARERIEALSLELRYAKESLQATVEEVEAGNEELHAANEELLAANEELQSTNEELQSVNEELYTVNAEYQVKIAELTELSSDMNHLLEATEVHTIFLDRDLCIRRFTPMIAETFHFLPQDIGRPIEHFDHRLMHPELMADLHHVLAREHLVEREVSDRQGCYYLLRILPYRPHDTVDGVVLTLVDISTLKHAEKELRLSEERYRTLMRAVTSLLWTADAAGGFTTPQPEWAAYTGQSEQEYRNRGWLDALHPEDRGHFLTAWEAALTQRTLHTDEVRVWSAAHRAYRMCVVRAAPLMDERHAVREWVGNILDVEDSKQAEARLRTREAQLAGILENSPAAIYIKDREGRYILGSRVAMEAVGAPDVSWMLGRTDFDFFPREIAEKLCATERQVRDSRKPLAVEEEIPWHGSRRVFLSVKFPLFDESGQVYAVAGVSNDITERKLLEEREREEVKRRDRFLAMMSHELRNPLGAILNAVHVLGHEGAAAAVMYNARTVIERQGQHMARLLDDLLDIGRISQGKIDMRMRDVDLAGLVKAAVDGVRARAEHKSLDMQVRILDAPLVVHGDAVRLEQVVSNLLLNAIKFTEREGQVWVELRHQNSEAVLVVRDTGIGLEEGEDTKVFEIFYQRDTSIDRAGGGLGVGLFLARELVALHGGRISARSDGRGQGSTFTVVLPLSTTREMMASKRNQGQGSGHPRGGITVVIIEDNDDSREMLELLLERRGHTVAVARDGREGMSLILERRPELALVDIGLPAMTGYDVARQIRAAQPAMNTYMVALTGYGRREDREAVLSAGFDEHIVKPLKLDELERLIARLSTQQPNTAVYKPYK